MGAGPRGSRGTGGHFLHFTFHGRLLMLCTFLSPEVTFFFQSDSCVLLEHYKEFIGDLAAPFPFE